MNVTDQIKNPIDGMTPEMKSAHADFYGDINRLKKEWMLCSQQYDKHLALGDIEVDFSSRMAIRKISDYWKNRRNALQGALSSDELKLIKENV